MAINIQPDYTEAYYHLGNVLKELGRLDEAVASHYKAIEIKPDYAASHNNLGNALKELGRLDEAVAHYQMAIDIQPDLATANNNLGEALLTAGQHKEGLKCRLKADGVIEFRNDKRRSFRILGGI